MKKMRTYAAGMLAVLLGVPLSEKAFGQGIDIAYGVFDVVLSAIDASGGS